MDAQELRNLQEAYIGVYIQEEVDLWVSDIIEEGYDIDEYTDEELLEAFLDERKNEDPKGVAYKAGINKPDAWGAPTKFGQEATRNSLAGGMKGVRTLQRAGVRINRHHRNKYLAHKVHQGWSKAAKKSEHQTPEQKERRSKLIKPDLATFRRDLPKHERDKDVPFVRKAERAVNKKGEFASNNEPQPTTRQQRLRQLQAAQRERNQAKGVSENYDLYDIVMDYLLDEGDMKKSPRNEKRTKEKAQTRKDRRLRIRYYGKNAVGHGTGEHLRPTQKEQVDLYDIILSHLLDEGYAETPEAAEVIMVNMSEDWRDSIIG